MKKVLFFLFSIMFFACSNKEPGQYVVASSEFIYDEATFPSCHASTIVEVKGGLLACWFGGSYESHPDVSIYGSTYHDGHWDAPRKIADGVISEDERYPCWNPVLLRLKNNDIVLFYKIGPNPREWWAAYKVSKDDGVTWSQSVNLPKGFLGPIKNKAHYIDKDLILYPTSIENTRDDWKVHLETSDSKLEQWNRIEINNDTLNAIQPTVLFHPKNRLQILCRTQEGCVATSWSNDAGKTWSPLSATTLPNNNSGIDAVTTKDGYHLLVYNPLKKGRNKLALAGSKDGILWEDLMVLEDEPKGEFSYPAIICGKNGDIHITYTYDRKKIKYVLLKRQ